MGPRIEEAELVGVLAALSLATDLANGNPLETALKTCLTAVELASDLGCSPAVRADVFFASLLRFIGCTAYSHEEAVAVGGDDIGTRNLFAPLDSRKPLQVASAAARKLAKGTGLRRRAAALATVAVRGQSLYAGMAQTNCEVAVRLAGRLGLPARVRESLGHLFERWDGRGAPRGVAGEAIPVGARVMFVAHVAELQHRHHGGAEALIALRERAGGQLDPDAVEAFVGSAERHFRRFEAPSVWDELLDSRPRGSAPALDLNTIAAAFADFVDLKSVYTLGHSVGVAELAERAGRAMGLPERDCEDLRVAGYLHDLGRVSVPTGVWEKKGALSTAEWERVRLHPYYSETVLKKSPLLARLAPLVAGHHERLDGSGYYRGSRGAELPVAARVLAAADAFQALLEQRPHRAAMRPEAAAKVLASLAPGQLDRSAVNAILELRGQRAQAPRGGPGGLTEREIGVLQHLARGRSNKEIAQLLRISPKTVDHHVQHIYDKISVSTRAGAALFAVENGLLSPEPLA